MICSRDTSTVNHIIYQITYQNYLYPWKPKQGPCQRIFRRGFFWFAKNRNASTVGITIALSELKWRTHNSSITSHYLFLFALSFQSDAIEINNQNFEMYLAESFLKSWWATRIHRKCAIRLSNLSLLYTAIQFFIRIK